MMSFCRICRTEDNLKYTLKELRRINKKLENNPKDLLCAVTITPTGNICYNCEELLHNFNKHDTDRDCDVVADREDSPVIVDDDELLYNLFFSKQNITKYKIPLQSTDHKFIQSSLGTSPNTGLVEVANSPNESTSPVYKSKANCLGEIGITTTLPSAIIDVYQADQRTGRDEEIYFRRANNNEIRNGNNNENRNIVRKCKNVRNCNVQIVASLSLLSSDSESEVSELLNKTSSGYNSLQQTEFPCPICDLKFDSTSELNCHQTTHKSADCPVCKASFVGKQKLVQHMRKKHRAYIGDVLKERPKCAQDSAMTIRLRYLQRYTFYECQLCGKIDNVFKEHKHHIITMHAAESKSLKDPMMKELNCPICKVLCGTQHVNLCTHLRAAHRDQHLPYLKEVCHIHHLGLNAERQRDVEATAKVFKFLSRKSRYFECKNCFHLSPGYFNHWKHLKKSICRELLYEKQKQSSEKNILTSHEFANDVTSKTKESNPNITCTTSNTAKGPLEEKNLKKLNACPLKTRPKNGLLNRKINKKPFKARSALVKVKVKTRLLQFPTLEYNCNYCSQKFEGFQALNIHKIRMHSMEETILYKHFNTSNYQAKERPVKPSRKRSPHNSHISKSKHNSIPDENSNTSYRCYHSVSTNEFSMIRTNPSALLISAIGKDNNENDWLQELMQFRRCGGNNINEKIYQCEYCTHLFSEQHKLALHVQKHISNQDIKTLKYITQTSN